ncbi:MAG: hypothetical protein PHH36_03290 [Sideroxydans sp.]|nr:hypothetical protein [Sideroxydans sp.]
MLNSLRQQYAQLITSGGQLVLLFAGFHLGSRDGWLWTLGGIAFISIFAWYSALHRYRMISGTPTSHIASAAQGYVELVGRAQAQGEPILGKYSMLPCLWYRYKVERRNSKNEWSTESTGQSETPFCIDDGSGICVIDPRGAEVITQHKDTWQVADHRYTEWKLIREDNLYALGEFRTMGGSNNPLTRNDLIKQVIAEWKLDNAELMRRFDLDGNGHLDIDEWMLARQAAKREADKRLTAVRNEPDTHFLRLPQDDRLFLLSNLSPDRLARRYAAWAWAHLTFFFSALAGTAWVLNSLPG